VGGATETVVAGDFELQVLLNEEGTLSAKFFNRENEIQAFLSGRQGYTQGAGLSYEVDFNSFKDLMQKMFKNRKSKNIQKKSDSIPVEVMGKDSLLIFHQKAKGH
jgi:hypothetical protein